MSALIAFVNTPLTPDEQVGFSNITVSKGIAPRPLNNLELSQINLKTLNDLWGPPIPGQAHIRSQSKVISPFFL